MDHIPIIEVDKSEGIDRKAVVLVSTIPKYHNEIEEILKKNGYTQIYRLGKGR